MKRRDFLGNVTTTQLANNISNTDTTIELLEYNTFPTGEDGEFVIVINRSFANEEKILISSRNNANLIVSQRGYDGTNANSHLSNSNVDHVLDAESLKDMNKVTYDNLIMTWVGI